MCAFGMMQEDKEGPGYVAKPTKFMTNSSEVASQLARKCPSLSEAGCHRHLPLSVHADRTRRAAIYPDGLCRVTLISDHRVLDGVTAAQALILLKETLNTSIIGELKNLKNPLERLQNDAHEDAA